MAQQSQNSKAKKHKAMQSRNGIMANRVRGSNMRREGRRKCAREMSRSAWVDMHMMAQLQTSDDSHTQQLMLNVVKTNQFVWQSNCHAPTPHTHAEPTSTQQCATSSSSYTTTTTATPEGHKGGAVRVRRVCAQGVLYRARQHIGQHEGEEYAALDERHSSAGVVSPPRR